MPKSSESALSRSLGSLVPKSFGAHVKNPRVLMRAILGTLLAANLVAAVMAFKPFGGSADDLRREQSDASRQLAQLQARVANTRKLVQKVEKARKEGDDFLAKYFSDRRTTYSTLFEELDHAEQAAGIKLRNDSLELNPIEGSDTLQMMSLTVAYEGDYASLEKFVNLLDKSPRFLIIESMQAAPQQNGQLLTVSLKLDAFVKEEPGASTTQDRSGPAL
jgi:Tfp pilus assembly protein PilO